MFTSLVLPLLLAQEIQMFIQRERYNINKVHTKSFFISEYFVLLAGLLTAI